MENTLPCRTYAGTTKKRRLYSDFVEKAKGQALLQRCMQIARKSKNRNISCGFGCCPFGWCLFCTMQCFHTQIVLAATTKPQTIQMWHLMFFRFCHCTVFFNTCIEFCDNGISFPPDLHGTVPCRWVRLRSECFGTVQFPLRKIAC